MVHRVGFVVNPIAGMGGKVGLKGTDGVINKAIELGAKPIAPDKAKKTIEIFMSKFLKDKKIEWYTCKGEMGESELLSSGVENIKLVYTPPEKSTSSEDTIEACKKFIEFKVDLVLFCGGDGTARDILSVVEKKIPILGIPSGVKMHSAVFGINTSASAKMLYEFINNRLTIGDIEIMDLDEEKYRSGEWNIRLFGIAKGIVEPMYVQVGKSTFEAVSDNTIKEEIADHISDELEEYDEYLFLFGSGGTIDFISKNLGFENTLLGIDAVYKRKTVGTDLNENDILALLKKYSKVKLILSPIGAQGFILGRGNLQLSPKVISIIGIDNIIVISTPSKLLSTPIIRVDTGDKKLDDEFQKREMMLVIIGYRLSRVVKIQTNKF